MKIVLFVNSLEMYSGVLCQINCIHSTRTHSLTLTRNIVRIPFHEQSSICNLWKWWDTAHTSHLNPTLYTNWIRWEMGERRHRRQKGGKVRIMTNSRMHKMCDQWASVCACVSKCTLARWLFGSLALWPQQWYFSFHWIRFCFLLLLLLLFTFVFLIFFFCVFFLFTKPSYGAHTGAK